MSSRRRSVDRYLRWERSSPARIIRALAPEIGHEYAESGVKREFDLALAIPASVAAVPIVAGLMIVNKILAPDLPALFVQPRVGRHGAMRVYKIRSLSGSPPNPRTTRSRFGHWMRRWHLDELPQVMQVLTGRLSIVGIRILPEPVYELLRDTWSPGRFAEWQRAYRSAPLGLTGVHQVYRRRGKDDVHRYHRDLFYARHASLGFDLYLLWRTIRCLGRVPG